MKQKSIKCYVTWENGQRTVKNRLTTCFRNSSISMVDLVHLREGDFPIFQEKERMTHPSIRCTLGMTSILARRERESDAFSAFLFRRMFVVPPSDGRKSAELHCDKGRTKGVVQCVQYILMA